ncbi:phosphodiester glycosidase family protein [Streptomyces sp. NPDC021019]|uniref:phosphodiester glycosidase family protein n=1 Tax=Streptomyces sp. NPDC021019 TaxID=3365108 RepID=UPI003789BEDC
MSGRWRVRAAALALAPLLLAACSADAPPESPRKSGPPAPGPAPTAQRLPDGVTFTRTTRRLDDGAPLRLSVLTVARNAPVRIRAEHGDGVVQVDTVGALARRAGAVAAVNGTFFDADAPRDTGDPLGLYVAEGILLSEAANGRTALVLPARGKPARITELSSVGRVTTAHGVSRLVDGTNRAPGRIVGCGGTGGDRLGGIGPPVTAPRPGRVCTDPDELVEFTAQWGASTPVGVRGSVEALLDARSTVIGLRSPAGGPLPQDGRSLVGTGSAAHWLRENARTGHDLTVSATVRDREGRAVPIEGTSVLGAGPALVRSGRIMINAAANGVSAGASGTRAPRTVAGIRADGTLLLAVFDGRRPGVSEGATLAEAARELLALGAVEAMNLDGGGSSTMVVRDRVRSSPSDPGRTDEDRQREVSNAIVVVPEAHR